VRVKRRLEDDPVDSLVLLCKKVKRGADVGSASACESDSTEAIKSVFKFAGTVSGAVSTQSSSPRFYGPLAIHGKVADSWLKIV